MSLNELQNNKVTKFDIDDSLNSLRTQMHESGRNQSSTKRHLVIATLELPPFVMKKNHDSISDSNTTNIEWYGYCIDLFQELIKYLPFEVTYEIYQVKDNKFGAKSKQVILENKNTSDIPEAKKFERWSGLVGELLEGRAQIALAPLAVMAERELVIDFTVPFYDLVGIQILLKKPEVPQDWFKFLTVLDKEVWFSITIAYFITSFVIFLFDRLSPYSHKNLLRLQKLKESRKKVIKINGANSHNNVNMLNSISNGVPLNGFGFLSKINTIPSGSINDERPPNMDRGPMCQSFKEIRRRSSALLSDAFETILGKSRRSVHPKTGDADSNYIGRKLSNSYLHGLNFGSTRGWNIDDDDTQSSELEDDGKPDFGIRDSLWFCITSLTPQGGGEAPQNLSGRVVAGAWWLFCFIVIASYTANLAAFLTVSRLEIPIESLDDLAKQYRIKYAPVDGSAEQTYFERMAYIEEIFYNIWKEMSLNDSLSEEERSKFAVWDYPISDKYTKIWAQIQEVGMPTDVEAAINRVKSSSLDDGFALLADANMVKHAVMTDCSFKAVGDEFSRKPIALGVRKGEDQLRDDLSYAILQLINKRFMEVLREKWWTNNPRRIVCDNNDESEGISIENIGGVFIIIFAGVFLSFFVWSIERFIYKTKIEVSRGMIETSK